MVWALPDIPDDYYDDEWREVSNFVGLGYPRWTGRGWADAARLPPRVGSPQLGRLGYRGTRDLSHAVLTISECRYSIAQLRAQFPALSPTVSQAALSRTSSAVDPAPMNPLVVGDHTTGLRGLALAAARHQPKPTDDECMAELLRSAENYATDAIRMARVSETYVLLTEGIGV